jgi:AbrB family looped-hinge helix DNA binding protein
VRTIIIRGKGQLTIPAEIRRQVNLEEGDPVEIEVVPEGILLRPQKVVDATQAWFRSPASQKREADPEADIVAGRFDRLGSDDELFAALRSRMKPAADADS